MVNDPAHQEFEPTHHLLSSTYFRRPVGPAYAISRDAAALVTSLPRQSWRTFADADTSIAARMLALNVVQLHDERLCSRACPSAAVVPGFAQGPDEALEEYFRRVSSTCGEGGAAEVEVVRPVVPQDADDDGSTESSTVAAQAMHLSDGLDVGADGDAAAVGGADADIDATDADEEDVTAHEPAVPPPAAPPHLRAQQLVPMPKRPPPRKRWHKPTWRQVGVQDAGDETASDDIDEEESPEDSDSGFQFPDTSSTLTLEGPGALAAGGNVAADVDAVDGLRGIDDAGDGIDVGNLAAAEVAVDELLVDEAPGETRATDVLLEDVPPPGVFHADAALGAGGGFASQAPAADADAEASGHAPAGERPPLADDASELLIDELAPEARPDGRDAAEELDDLPATIHVAEELDDLLDNELTSEAPPSAPGVADVQDGVLHDEVADLLMDEHAAEAQSTLDAAEEDDLLVDQPAAEPLPTAVQAKTWAVDDTSAISEGVALDTGEPVLGASGAAGGTRAAVDGGAGESAGSSAGGDSATGPTVDAKSTAAPAVGVLGRFGRWPWQ